LTIFSSGSWRRISVTSSDKNRERRERHYPEYRSPYDQQRGRQI